MGILKLVIQLDKNENNWPNFWQGLYAYAYKRGDELKELYFKVERTNMITLEIKIPQW